MSASGLFVEEGQGDFTVSGDVRMADADGLANVSFSYQWIRRDGTTDIEIAGATGPSYTLTSNDQDKTMKVRVSFTDDAGNGETLTSGATGPAAARPPLTASLENEPGSHDGQTAFTFNLRFSEEFDLSYETLKLHAFTLTGGTVDKARRLNKPSNILWQIAVDPDGNGDVEVVLPATTDCADPGAICTREGRMLANRLEFTVSGPGQ